MVQERSEQHQHADGRLLPEAVCRAERSYGSFNTHKETVKVGTGLINDHWSFDARLSNISSDGYIDRASVGLNSYYLQGGYYNDNTSVKLITSAAKNAPTMPGTMPAKKK